MYVYCQVLRLLRHDTIVGLVVLGRLPLERSYEFLHFVIISFLDEPHSVPASSSFFVGSCILLLLFLFIFYTHRAHYKIDGTPAV